MYAHVWSWRASTLCCWFLILSSRWPWKNIYKMKKGDVNEKDVSEEDDKDTEIFLGATKGGLTKRHKTTFFLTNTMKKKKQEKCGYLLTPLED